MKIYKQIIGILVLLLMCSGCGLFGPQRYICEVENVKSVEIVSLDQYVEGQFRFDCTTLAEISDYDEFIEKLTKIKHSVNWGDPYQLDEGNITIRINYNNGDFDLLYYDAQLFNRDGVNQYGFFVFDEKQFNDLIEEYLS